MASLPADLPLPGTHGTPGLPKSRPLVRVRLVLLGRLAEGRQVADVADLGLGVVPRAPLATALVERAGPHAAVEQAAIELHDPALDLAARPPVIEGVLDLEFGVAHFLYVAHEARVDDLKDRGAEPLPPPLGRFAIRVGARSLPEVGQADLPALVPSDVAVSVDEGDPEFGARSRFLWISARRPNSLEPLESGREETHPIRKPWEAASAPRISRRTRWDWRSATGRSTRRGRAGLPARPGCRSRRRPTARGRWPRRGLEPKRRTSPHDGRPKGAHPQDLRSLATGPFVRLAAIA
ncbi:hypothetical protein BSF38_04798 [Paludisphaera borealis]|uniref:Uncharacterized protein n=1 Tax=Paludisphaera borealis TaxID=1387353 RepID=A0A1U7CWB6_9BACT|nr:hypothetical protein BSF38_04798 [Paludisphaera borealis]